MKSDSIEILHRGDCRRVEKLQYSKIRPYNKIKTSRVKSVRTLTSCRSQRFNEHRLTDAIEELRNENRALTQEITGMRKLLRKEEKVDRVMAKCGLINYEQGERNEEARFKNLSIMLEVTLSLQVIKLQSVLQEKIERFGILSNPRKANEKLREEKQRKNKAEFLLSLFADYEQIHNKEGQLKQRISTLEQLIHSQNLKVKILRNSKQNEQKVLQQTECKVWEMQQQAEQRERIARKKACKYIEVQNGEIRNEDDIKNEINAIVEQRKEGQKQLQSFLQNTMKDKITLINQIQSLQKECKKLGIVQAFID